MISQLLLFVALMVIIIFFSFFTTNKESNLSRRKTQSQNHLRENVLKKSLEKYITEKVQITKRYKIETLCLQAGYNLSYTEYLLVSVFSAVFLGVVIGIIMSNPYLGIMFVLIGWVIPKQFITFVKNQRLTHLEKQIGSMMQMVIKRYEATKDFAKALEITMNEFRGEEPIYTELRTVVAEIKSGTMVGDAMDNLARRTGNKYLARLSDYYKIASSLGTEEVRRNLLNQAFQQFEENRKAKASMKKELAGPKNEAFIMLGTIPAFAVYQVFTNPNYIAFMTQTSIGKIGTTVITGVFVGCLWFVNAKIGAPLE